ncbi:putative acetyltransferase [Escherichia coli]|nr:putative acetyltransferase [Escherichia coli]
MNNIAPQSPVMRRLTLQDNPAIARVIRQVSAEYGLTADKGYTVADPNLDELYQVYSQPGHAYWVVEYEGEVVGGGGIAPLTGSESDICELQKMYFLPAIRGKGLAKKTGLNGDGAGARDGFQTLLSGNDRFFKGSHCAL